jgi:TP901 family phage tail tape measure protein
VALGLLGEAIAHVKLVVDSRSVEAQTTKGIEEGVNKAAAGANVKRAGERAGQGFSGSFSSALAKESPSFARSGERAGQTWADRFGTAAGAATGTIAKFGAIGLAAAAIGSVDLAVKFQTAMKRVQTQAGASAKDVKILSDGILHLKDVQQSPIELANAMYHLKSVGLSNADAMKALAASSHLAAVGGAGLEETTNAIAGAWRSGIKGAQTFGQAAGTVNAIIGAGNMRMADFIAAIGTGFLPSARSFGLSLKNVGAALALMTDEGIPANVAATRLRMSFSLLGAPSKIAESNLKSIGVTGLQLANAMRTPGGLITAIGLLKHHLDDSGLSAAKQSILLSHAFGGGRSSSAILTLINNYDVLRRKQEQINHSLGKFPGAVAAQAKTTAASLHLLGNQFEVLFIQVGTKLLPPLTKFLNFIVRTHAILPLLAAGLAIVTAAIIAATVAWIAANVATAGILLAVGLLAAGLVLLFAHWHTIWPAMVRLVHPVVAAVEGFVSRIYHDLLPAFRVIATIAKWTWRVIYTTARIAFDIISGLVLLEWHIFYTVFWKPMAAAAVWLFKTIIAPIVTWWYHHVMQPIFSSVAHDWHVLWANASKVFNATVSFVKNAAKTMWDQISTIFGLIINGAAKAFGWVPGLGPKLKDAAKAFNHFRDQVNAALGGVSGRTVHVGVAFSAAQSGTSGPSLAHPAGAHSGGLASGGMIRHGTTSTADDVPAWLSRGEYVVKASSVAKYGPKMMDSINAGRYASGGIVGQGISVRPELPAQSVINSTVNAAVEALARKWATSFSGPGAQSIVADAMRWIGRIPYVWGGTSVPGGADCSGFVQTIYGRHGITAPRTSEAQGAWVRRSPPVPGGLALYNSPAGGAPPGHVAIIGNRGMVISQGGGLGPQYVPINSMDLMFTGVPPRGFANGGRVGSYDRGGWLPPGLSLAYNGTGQPEPVGAVGRGGVHIHGDLIVREQADIDLIAQRLAFALDGG